MGQLSTVPADAPPWGGLADERIITEQMLLSALTTLELRHTEFLDTQRPVAERLAQVAGELGRGDLQRRARLVLADATTRVGELVFGSTVARTVQAEAEAANDAFALARAHYLLAWVAHSIGDVSAAQINGMRGVELLPDGTPEGIVTDHLTILAIAYYPAVESMKFFNEALALAYQSGDAMRSVMIRNNIAYAAIERGDLTSAQEHVTAMLADAERAGIELRSTQRDTAARVYNADGRYDAAIEILAPVASAAEADPSVVEVRVATVPAALLTLAQAYRGLGDLQTARSVLDRASVHAAGDDLRALAAKIGQERARLHAASGDFQRAYYEYVAFHEATVQVLAEDEAARARIVQASFDAERSRMQAAHFRDLAMRDALTGLYNRRYMDELLERVIPAAAHRAAPLSLAIVDADFFKRINDELSHEVGDAVLRTLAEVLLQSRPEGSTVCRLGGEEFVVVMPDLPASQAVHGCELMRLKVADHDWAPLTGIIQLTVSIGVTTAPAGQTTASALLSGADRNLYAAKRAGRDRVRGS